MAEGFSSEDLVKNLLNNPELLKNAVEMAGALSESGALDGLLSGLGRAMGSGSAPEGENSPHRGGETAEGGTSAGHSHAAEAASPLPAGVGRGFGRDIARHKKLLQALCLYMEGERKEKLEFVIRLLEILELAGGLRG